MTMSIHLGWGEAGLRLALAAAAGLIIGYNRTEHGKAAGLRTTLLVCLAAAVAMIQVNLLLPMAGRPDGSFVMNDLMRLPLGILTGVGFIGAGAIVRRDDLVVGVTTAATLWYVTVVGLCLGGGQIGLGISATALGVGALWAMGWLEDRLRRERNACLAIELDGGNLDENRIRQQLAAAGLRVLRTHTAASGPGVRRELIFDVSEYNLPEELHTPAVVEALAREQGVVKLEWRRR